MEQPRFETVVCVYNAKEQADSAAFNQVFQMVAYCTILAVAVLGAFNGRWYFLLLGAAVLTFVAVRDQRQFQPRFAALGMAGLLETAAYASAARALLAAIAAYGLGAVARLVFS